MLKTFSKKFSPVWRFTLHIWLLAHWVLQACSPPMRGISSTKLSASTSHWKSIPHKHSVWLEPVEQFSQGLRSEEGQDEKRRHVSSAAKKVKALHLISPLHCSRHSIIFESPVTVSRWLSGRNSHSCWSRKQSRLEVAESKVSKADIRKSWSSIVALYTASASWPLSALPTLSLEV